MYVFICILYFILLYYIILYCIVLYYNLFYYISSNFIYLPCYLESRVDMPSTHAPQLRPASPSVISRLFHYPAPPRACLCLDLSQLKALWLVSCFCFTFVFDYVFYFDFILFIYLFFDSVEPSLAHQEERLPHYHSVIIVQWRAVPCSAMQCHAVPCSAM